jgi:hypothetical protein
MFLLIFFAQHFRSSLPLRSYVRDLLCAIARTGAVSLSTGHRPTESQSPGSWAMSRSVPLPSGRSIWLCHGCHVLSRQGPVAVRYLSGALAAFTPPDRLASFRTFSTSTAPTRCRDSTRADHMRSRRPPASRREYLSARAARASKQVNLWFRSPACPTPQA